MEVVEVVEEEVVVVAVSSSLSHLQVAERERDDVRQPLRRRPALHQRELAEVCAGVQPVDL